MKKETRNPNRLLFRNRKVVKEYLKAKELFRDRLWSLVNGVFVTNYNGEWLSENELIERLPILRQSSLLANLQNPNVKKNYLR